MTIRRFVRMAHCMRVLPGTPGRAGRIHSGTISHGLPVRKSSHVPKEWNFLFCLTKSLMQNVFGGIKIPLHLRSTLWATKNGECQGKFAKMCTAC